MISQDCQRSRGSCRQRELQRGRGQCRVEHQLFADARMTDVRWNGSSTNYAMYRPSRRAFARCHMVSLRNIGDCVGCPWVPGGQHRPRPRPKCVREQWMPPYSSHVDCWRRSSEVLLIPLFFSRLPLGAIPVACKHKVSMVNEILLRGVIIFLL